MSDRPPRDGVQPPPPEPAESGGTGVLPGATVTGASPPSRPVHQRPWFWLLVVAVVVVVVGVAALFWQGASEDVATTTPTPETAVTEESAPTPDPESADTDQEEPAPEPGSAGTDEAAPVEEPDSAPTEAEEREPVPLCDLTVDVDAEPAADGTVYIDSIEAVVDVPQIGGTAATVTGSDGETLSLADFDDQDPAEDRALWIVDASFPAPVTVTVANGVSRYGGCEATTDIGD